jgi:putative spermidine/putrescine transport system permease protein
VSVEATRLEQLGPISSAAPKAPAPKTVPRNWSHLLLLTPNLIWIGLFMAGALVVLATMSFRGYEAGGRGILRTWELTHYAAFLGDPFYRDILWRSLGMAMQVTLWCLILGFPLAYMLSRLRGWSRALLYFTILMPLLTSAVVRTFGWMILLSNNGFLNKTLISLRLTEAPIPMMYRMTGIVIALVEVLLPFMVLALDAALLNIDRQLYDAARNLGAGATRIFLLITLPLSLPGIISGSLLVFVLAISAFVTPALIGGPRIPVMSTLIHQQGIALLNWPFGAAISFVMLFTLLVLLAVTLSLAAKAEGRAR